MELRDSIVLVTGAASGIGQATAVAFGAAAANVILSDVAPLSATEAMLADYDVKHESVVADVTNEESVAGLVNQCIESMGRIDVAVHCAGVLHHEPLLTTDARDFDRVVTVNLRGTFLVGRAVLSHMRSAGKGRLINIASDLSYVGREGFSAYCASKAGVLSLTRTWAREFAPDIRVNAICPGPIDTPMLGPESLAPEWRKKELDIPLKRFGKPSEVAEMALFLAGPGGAFVTGQGIGVNGGSVMA